MPRPSPRTGTTGAGIQKFGTQQLKYLDTSQPALGVKEMDVGARTRIFGLFPSFGTQPVYSGGSTPFSQRYQEQRPATVRTLEQLETSDRVIPEGWGGIEFPDLGLGDLFTPKDTGCECQACKDGTGQCSDKNPKCDAWDIGCELFGANDKHGCECQACKDGTGQCSDKVPQCDAWDLVCEGTGGATVGVVGGTNYFFWAKIILAVIGIGILLWLLRPLFGVAKNVTGIKSQQ